MMITQSELKELITYDPETGIIKWINSGKGRRLKPTNISDCNYRKDGYLTITIGKKAYLGHRIAWLYMTGKWPKYFIDHINGDPSDNSFLNLRDLSHQKNHFNRAPKGYSYNKQRGNYQARITVDGKNIHLGNYQTKDEAHAAYLIAKPKYHGKEFSTRLL